MPERIAESGPTGLPSSNSASGRVILAGSGQGIAGLGVEIHDASVRPPARLGSGATDGGGEFHLALAPPRASIGGWLGRGTRSLVLRVLAPEGAAAERRDRLLFESEPRHDPAPHEHFRVALTEAVLRAAGIEPRAAVSASAASQAAAIDSGAAQASVLQAATEAVSRKKLAAVAERRKTFRDVLRGRLAAELSQVAPAERAGGRFVPAPAEIGPATLRAMRADVDALTAQARTAGDGRAVGRTRLRGRMRLDERQAMALLGPSGQPVVLSEQEVEARLGATLDKPPAVFRRHLEPDPCRPRTGAERCLEEAPAAGGGTGATDDGGAGGEDGAAPPAASFDQAAAVAALLRRQASPEEPVTFGATTAPLEPPLAPAEVAAAVHAVAFAPGPADVPSFHDFHDLQIAFEPVWQEALDERFLDDVEAAYDRFVERGGAPATEAVTRLTGGSGPLFDSLADALSDLAASVDDEVPAAVASLVLVSLEEWRALPGPSQNLLVARAAAIAELQAELLEALDPDEMPDLLPGFDFGDLLRAVATKHALALRSRIGILTADAERLVAHARRLLVEREAGAVFRPTHALIDELRRRRTQAYPFRHFAASAVQRSVNFGILVTYRHQWTPVAYQVGELVGTVPLAPKETRKYTRRTVVRTRQARKEVESNLSSRRSESEERSRAEADIVARAQTKTHFSLNQQGGIELFGAGGTTTSTFERDAERHSESVKKEFREAILKGAEEYRNERRLEIDTESAGEDERTETREIQNPNDEIPVTFLFYELQRRYKVAEKIHRLQSLVLVAQEVPAPAAIDNTWVIRHDWILNRVLLDDSFRPALTYISTSVIGQEVALREQRQAIFRQRRLVEELKEDVADRRVQAGLRYAALERQIERTARSAGSGGGLFGALGDVVGSVPIAGDLVQGGLDMLSGRSDGPTEAAQLREGAARDAFEREQREEDAMASRLAHALAGLDALQRDHAERLAQHLTQVAQCERLLEHLRQNVLHYMQAIWSHEPEDQRYLRLRNVPVPVFEKNKARRAYEFTGRRLNGFIDIAAPGAMDWEVFTDLGVDPPAPDPQRLATRPLCEVADLGRPLGFKGNYMIFPLVAANPITEFMMDPYVTLAEGEYGLSDPDPLGNITLDEFSDYVCCLRRHSRARAETAGVADGFEALKPGLRDVLRRLLELSRRHGEEVVVPSGALYIEALPGAHSVMERFKQLHRQVDVKQAQSELRASELDNIRRAQRILDGQLEDPDIEAKYVFDGAGSATVVAPGAPPPARGGA